MLETATTSSMTNRLNVPELSSTPIGWMRLNIQARPKNKSSNRKRRRHAFRSMVSFGVFRKLRHANNMTRWISRTAAVHVPEVSAPVHTPESAPIEHTRMMMTSEPDSRFCAN